jgi:flagellar biosynthesis protein FlhB
MEEQNKSEQATPHKLSEARKRGQVAKSLDCISLIGVTGLLIALLAGARQGWLQLADLSRQLFEVAGVLVLSEATFPTMARELVSASLEVLMPFAAVGILCAVLGNVLQSGPIFSLLVLQPKFERLNPVAGFKRLFNKKMLFEALKSVVKLALFAFIAMMFFRSLWPALSILGALGVNEQLQWLADNAVALLFRLLLVMALFAVIDLALTRWLFARQMMMSKREVKEEVKRREGDPLVRAKIRELQRENLEQSRSMQRVPEADVLITNPQHLAIALRYDRARMSAPQIIAKGAERWAQQMRATAARHGIPMFEQRRLARALFRHGALGACIPAESFVEVARIYAELGQRERADGRYEHTA